MRFLCIVLLLCCGAFGFDKDTAQIIQTYRTKSIEATKDLLEKYLQDKNFWLNVLQERDTNFGYFEGYEFLFVSNKSAPNLTLYKIAPDGKLTMLHQVSALVAIGKGQKQKEGDMTTPIGVYDFTGKLSGLPPYYGPLAFATDYPNSYDKSLRKTGSGIWIHGLPLDGNRTELNTKGCIAIENPILAEIGKIVDYKTTLLITYEKEFKSPSKEDIANLLSQLYKWRDTWINNDIDAYLGFYSKNFIRPDGMKFSSFTNYKRQVFEKKEDKVILFSNISVVPYPNDEGRVMFRISFEQDYKAYKNGKPSYTSKSNKVLYVAYENNKMQILSEK